MSDPAPTLFRIENPLTQPEWNERLREHPHSTIFHTREWASVLHQAYGFTPHYVTAAAGDPFKLLPLMEVNSPITGRRGISLPFTDHCEPLGFGRASANLIPEILRHGTARNWKYLELRGELPGTDFPSKPMPSLSFFTHELALDGNLENLRANFLSATDRAVRKAEKSGLQIEIGTDPDAMRHYYSLHCETRKLHGLPPQPFRFFQLIQKEIMARDLGVIISARLQQHVIASAIFLRFGKQVIYKFGASSRAFQQLRANNLVMWEALKWSVQQGAEHFHFGRTSLNNEGLRRFKLGWGAKEKQLAYYKYDFRQKTFAVDHDDTAGWHTRVFQNLPIFLNRWLGAALYRHIA